MSQPWDAAIADIAAAGFAPSAFIKLIHKDAQNWLSRYQAFAIGDGVVTTEEWRTFRDAAYRLCIAAEALAPLAATMDRAYRISEVRAGRLANIQLPDLHLPIDEHCHYISDGVRWRELRSGPAPTRGRVILTSKNFTFAAPSQGGQIPWSKITCVTPFRPGTVVVEASSSRLSGAIGIPDAEWLVEVSTALIRIDRRQVLGSNPGRVAIPQHVKAEVWRRDAGRCRECGLDGSGGASLEFDHIIPVALGGATSVANLQVLCRKCNALKGARI